MRPVRAFLILTFSSLISSQVIAFVGAVDGGGGKGVVCRNKAGEITSAELLDLYEGRVQHGLDIRQSSKPYMDQAIGVAGPLGAGRGEGFQQVLESYLVVANANMHILEPGTGLPPTDDSHHVILPKHCKVEQLAVYTNQDKLLIDGEIWAELDETNKAALMVHEALYKLSRAYGARDSRGTRKGVAFGFAGEKTEDISRGVPQGALICVAVYDENDDRAIFQPTRFWAYNDEYGNLIFQFDYIESRLMLTTTTVNVDRMPVGDLDKQKPGVQWMSLDSGFDQGESIALGFSEEEWEGESHIWKWIGFAAAPNLPKQKFICFSDEGESKN